MIQTLVHPLHNESIFPCIAMPVSRCRSPSPGFFLALSTATLLLLVLAAAAPGQTDPRGIGVKGEDDPEREGPAEFTGERVALVLGNAAYEALDPLDNSDNDAEDMAETLQALGFDVVERIDRPRSEMLEAIQEFTAKARGADVALLFYAGHGVEVAGENYLLPVDAGFTEQEFRIDRIGVPLTRALVALKQARTQVIVLDACRDNPLPPQVTAGRTGGGWAMPSAEIVGGTLVAYGTAPGSWAEDNPTGRNGVFTGALLEEIRVPGLEAGEMMRRVTRRVREATDDSQSPWLSTSYVLPFYFIPPDERSDDLPETTASASLSQIETWAQQGASAYEQEDYETALPLLRQAARAGHTESQYMLGTMHLAGLGIPEAPELAADWFELASMAGHIEAQYFLGGMYSGGFGRRRDDDKAADLYERAAEQGLAVGQFRLGIVYESGRGRAENLDTALEWYFRAARQDHEDARAALERLAKKGNEQARAMLRRLDG